jgi:hypothetical protein
LQHFGSHGGEECWQHPSEFELSFCWQQISTCGSFAYFFFQ